MMRVTKTERKNEIGMDAESWNETHKNNEGCITMRSSQQQTRRKKITTEKSKKFFFCFISRRRTQQNKIAK